jgi:hypothetical protein
MPDLRISITSSLYAAGGKVITPDKDGVYRRVPLMVLGKVSRNNKDYEINSMVNCIVSPNSIFNKKMRNGQLEGEWCHPLIWEEADMPRTMMIDRTKVSHLFLRVYTEATELRNAILYGDLMCVGPMGKFLAESFANPFSNTAFSLRSMVDVLGKDGAIYRQKVLALVTIDAIDCPGYAEASKLHESSLEGLIDRNIPVNRDDFNKLAPCIGFESYNDPQLQEIFNADKVTVMHHARGVLDVTSKSLILDNGERASVFHNVFNMRG